MLNGGKTYELKLWILQIDTGRFQTGERSKMRQLISASIFSRIGI